MRQTSMNGIQAIRTQLALSALGIDFQSYGYSTHRGMRVFRYSNAASFREQVYFW
jgi:hypothetical protein